MILKLYLDFIKSNWKYYLFYIATLIAIPLQQAGLPHLYGKIINNLKGKNIESAKKYLFYLLVVWIIIQISFMLEKYGEIQIWPRLEAYIEEQLFSKIIDSYNTSFEELKVGEILTKMIKLPWIMDYIQDQVKHFFVDNMLVIMTNIFYLFYHSPYLGFGYLVSMVLYFGLSYFFDKSCKDNLYLSEIQYDKVHGIMEDSLNNLLSIYTNNKHQLEKDYLNTENSKTVEYQLNKEHCNTKYKVYFTVLNIIIFVGLNYTALYLYTNNKLNLGGLVAVFILNYNILHSLIMFYKNAKTVIEFKANLKYVNNFLNSIPQEEKLNSLNIEDDLIDIKLININYSHDNNKQIFKNFNLHIPKGESIAFMGGVGSGKSTIAKLIIRLLKYNSGEIFINDVPLSQYNINSIRNNIIYVPQSPILFDRTLWDNLIYGLPPDTDIEPQKIYDILESVNLRDIIKIFKEKMHKGVGKKGSELSGGQRQIVWLLRCLLQNSNVIILDEPTSALDEESKENIKNLIEYMCKNKTVILITHDKSIIEYMDRLIVLDKGEIIRDTLLPHNKTKSVLI